MDTWFFVSLYRWYVSQHGFSYHCIDDTYANIYWVLKGRCNTHLLLYYIIYALKFCIFSTILKISKLKKTLSTLKTIICSIYIFFNPICDEFCDLFIIYIHNFKIKWYVPLLRLFVFFIFRRLLLTLCICTVFLDF